LRAATKSARPLAVIVEHVEREIMTLDDAVVELSDVDATPDVAKLIADRVEPALGHSDARPVRAGGRAGRAAVPRRRVADQRLLGDRAMRRRRRRGSDGSPAKVLEQYQNISLETAQRVLRFLKVRETAEAS